MERSRSQVLFSYLPGSVFIHESGMVVCSHSLLGQEVSAEVNKQALLDAIDEYLQSWEPDQRAGLPLPSQVDASEFRIITPKVVIWEIWPLVFECINDSCGRIRRFWKPDEILGQATRCSECGRKLRQLRYFSAHACGAVKQMHVPQCQTHGLEHVFFEDTGSFRTSVFRCRACGGAVIRRTLQSPCSCGDFQEPDGRSMMRAYTVRDSRTYYPHYISLINFQSSTFNQLQRHPARGRIAVACYLGVSDHVGEALEDTDRSGHDSKRRSPEEWTKFEVKLKAMGMSDEEIAGIKQVVGPANSGLTALPEIAPSIIELGKSIRLLERTVLFDQKEVKRHTLEDAERMAEDRGQRTAGFQKTSALARSLGLEEISVTWNFPVAMGAFGYTRSVRGRGEGRIRGFGASRLYDGKTPVFGVATETEAVIIVVSAQRVVEWLARRNLVSQTTSKDDSSARLEILSIFAAKEANPDPAEEITVLLHSMSHALLRALDDGQIGFSEASLAEWIVPEMLTFALYANNLKSFTLGSLWTLLNNRALQWLESAREAIWHCENDPLCHQRSPQACERCLYITFGCRRFNDNLSRTVLQGFWAKGQ